MRLDGAGYRLAPLTLKLNKKNMLTEKQLKGKVKDIKISPLFEAGKRYNIDKQSKNYYKEDPKGTLFPDISHCWLSWKSYFKDEDGEHWMGEANMYRHLENAKIDKKKLEKFL